MMMTCGVFFALGMFLGGIALGHGIERGLRAIADALTKRKG